MSIPWEWECPICHNGDIEEDDCFDTDHGSDRIIEYYTGHCLACGRNFQWQRIYKFETMTPFEED